MLTSEKVQATYRLLDVMIYIFENKVGARKVESFGTSLEAMYGIYSIEDQYKNAFYTILREIDDDWFIVSIHPESEKNIRRQANSYSNSTPHGDKTCTFCFGDRLGFLLQETTDIIPVLPKLDYIESDLFQVQTMHNDYISFCLMIEVYLRSKIQDYYYMPVNIDKLLKMETYHIESLVTFWSNYIEAHEEIGCD